MSDRPDWDDQFAETEDKRNERLRAKPSVLAHI